MFWHHVGQILWQLRTLAFIQRIRCGSLFCLLIALRLPLLLLWYLDEWLWPEYKETPIVNPIFIVSAPRTGSTRLHELVLEGSENELISFKLHQLLNPSLTGQWLVRKMDEFDRRVCHGRFQKGLTWLEQRLISSEVQSKHRISLSKYEEDEFFFVFWYLTTVFVTHLAPLDVVHELQYGADKAMFAFYVASVQKLLYFHHQTTNGATTKRFVSKSHGIFHTEALQTAFVSSECLVGRCHFVACLRDSASARSSFNSLRASALEMFSGPVLSSSRFTQQYLAYDVRYRQAELKEWKGQGPVPDHWPLLSVLVLPPSGKKKIATFKQMVGFGLAVVAAVWIVVLLFWFGALLFISRTGQKGATKAKVEKKEGEKKERDVQQEKAKEKSRHDRQWILVPYARFMNNTAETMRWLFRGLNLPITPAKDLVLEVAAKTQLNLYSMAKAKEAGKEETGKFFDVYDAWMEQNGSRLFK